MKNQRVKHYLPIGYVQERLTVLTEAYSVRISPTATKRCVDCRCSCGNTKQVKVSEIASGRAKSCGCLSREALDNGVSKYEAGFRATLRVYKYSAKQRGLMYELSEKCLFTFVKSNCHYCGKPPNKPHRKCETFLYNGLDRVDNSVGYIESNVVPCCYICNKMKGDLSTEVFLEHLNNIFTRIA